MASPVTPYSTTPPNNVPQVGWPANLPQCAVGWDEETMDMRVRTKMSVGPPKTRRRYSLPMRKVMVTMDLHKSDYVELRAFYEGGGPDDSGEDTGGTAGGYKFFKFKHPFDSEFHYYRFVTPPKFKANGPERVMASMTWEEL